ncbi:MAG: aminoacyl-tRNA hydrolase [Algiphilus sp.]|uniref:aminoacyl-tRNA hydrolase n=1 Tax=Algiphilus sp. TaxID=1872431 RepID=UPI0032EC8C27
MSLPVRLIAGLGNPGPGYAATRHNAGFWFVDALAAHAASSWKAERRFSGETSRLPTAAGDLWLLKPDTFMNRSGQAVRAVCDFYKIAASEVLVVHDDLDLPAGTVRLKRGGGHGGHNGLRDIHRHLGTPDYCRLRVGIGHPGQQQEVLNYVLGKPTAEESRAIGEALVRAAEALDTLLSSGWERACTQLHTAPTQA